MFRDQFNRDEFAELLASDLRILRAGARLSQSEVAHAVGISRQTYSSYENKTRVIPWNMCLALLFYFQTLPDARRLLDAIHLVPNSTVANMTERDESEDFGA